MYGTCNPYLPVRPVLAPGGEMPRSEDIRLTRDFLFFLFGRGAYCASVIISLLGIPLETSPDSPAYAAGHKDLFSGLGEWVGRCKYPETWTFSACH